MARAGNGNKGGPKVVRRMERVASEEVPTIYTNNIQVKLSYFDVIFELGLIEDASPERVLVRDVAKVAMSPQHARALNNILTEKLAEYEQQFGPLPRARLAKGARPVRPQEAGKTVAQD